MAYCISISLSDSFIKLVQASHRWLLWTRGRGKVCCGVFILLSFSLHLTVRVQCLLTISSLTSETKAGHSTLRNLVKTLEKENFGLVPVYAVNKVCLMQDIQKLTEFSFTCRTVFIVTYLLEHKDKLG